MLQDNRTIKDFFDGRAYTGSTDSVYCAQMKALVLWSRASRLFDDYSPSANHAQQINELKYVAREYMTSLPTLEGSQSPSKQFILTWQILYT